LNIIHSQKSRIFKKLSPLGIIKELVVAEEKEA